MYEYPYGAEDDSDYHSPPAELPPLSQVPSLSWGASSSEYSGHQTPFSMHELARFIEDYRHIYAPTSSSEGTISPSYEIALVPGLAPLAPLTRTISEASTANNYCPELEGKAYSSADLL